MSQVLIKKERTASEEVDRILDLKDGEVLEDGKRTESKKVDYRGFTMKVGYVTIEDTKKRKVKGWWGYAVKKKGRIILPNQPELELRCTRGYSTAYEAEQELAKYIDAYHKQRRKN